MIIRDEFIDQVRLLVGLNQPGDGVEEMQIHAKNISFELSSEFESLMMRQVDLTSVNGVITFPDDVLEVKSMWAGDVEIQPVDHTDFQRINSTSTINDIVRIEENAGSWIGTISGSNASEATTLTLIYRSFTQDVGVFPLYFQRLIMLGVGADYYLWRDLGEPEKESKLRARYEQALGKARELQAHGRGEHVRRRSQFELDWNRALRNLLVKKDKDVG